VSPRRIAVFIAAMAAAWLPQRHWQRLPASFPMPAASFVSGLVVLAAGCAIGIPGFLDHARGITSSGLDAALGYMWKSAVYRGDLVMGNSGLSIFTFLLLTPTGWVTDYLVGTGVLRMAASWFDDPVGDPILTAADDVVWRYRARRGARRAQRERETREGPEIPDRIVSSAAAGIGDCDFVIVSSRRKPGWERGAAVLTDDGCYRLGEPVEQTVAGRLRTLYPLTAHNDFEAIRRSVRYTLPKAPPEIRRAGD
jgi:hypothetical protein